MSPFIFAVGDNVEVKGNGTWSPATVFRSNGKPDDYVMIQYTKSTRNDVVSVSVSILRPSPPLKCPEFRQGEFVEVFQNPMGWRSGKFLGLRQDLSCAVLNQDKGVDYVDYRDLRPYLHWIDGSWVKLKIKDKEINPLMETKLRVGSKVEVRTDEDGYEGARYAATIVGPLKQKTYLVEYHTIKTDDLMHPLREVIKEENVRPYPPKTPRKTMRYRKGQVVDVWYHEGWWEGVFLRAVDEFNYMVYFATTKEVLPYRRTCLRPHQDWIDGKWVTPLPQRKGCIKI